MQQVEAARAFLPWWVGWSNALVFLTAVALLASLVMWVTQRLTLRRLDPAMHWTRRARHAAMARGEAGRVFFTVLILAVVFAMTSVGPLSRLSGGVLALLAFAVSYWIAGRFGFARERRLLGPWLDRRRWRRGARSFFWLGWSPWLVTMLMAFLTPTDGRVWTFVSLGVGALVLLWLFDDGVFQVLRLLRLVSPAPPELAAIIAEACAKAGRPPARAQVLESWMSNAFAQAHRDTITFTSRALEILTRDELLAVAHHEVGHLGERGLARRRGLVAVPLLVAVGALRPIVTWYGLPGALVVLVVVFVAVTLLTRLSRRSEHAADAHAHGHSGDAATYVRALEKLHEHNLAPAVQRGKRHSHPDLWDRMQAASVQPEWRRPAPPDRSTRADVATALLLVFMILPGVLAVRHFEIYGRHDPQAAWWSLALTAGDDEALGTLGREACEAGRLPEAYALLRTAHGLAPWRTRHGAWLARVLVRQHRVDEAAAVLDAIEPIAEYAQTLVDAVKAELAEERRR